MELSLETYRSLRDAVLDLDPVLINTLAAFSIEADDAGLTVRFRFAFYGQALEDPRNVDQYPDIEVRLESDGGLDAKEEIDSLEDTELVGGFHAIEVAPGWPGNTTERPKWIVKTHSKTQAERIEWRNRLL